MMVPDSLWEWGQERYGTNNPSDYFRLIIERARWEDNAAKISASPKEKTAAEMVSWSNEKQWTEKQSSFDPNSYSDPMPARFPGYCWGSGEEFDRGALICMKNGRAYLFEWVRAQEAVLANQNKKTG